MVLLKNPSSVKNYSRADFTYNYWHTWQGRFFSGVIKPAMRAVLKNLKSMIIYYDKDAFVFDDPRLQIIRDKVSQNFKRVNYDEDFKTAVDISLFILKEDIYYRAGMMQIINDIKDKDYTLTDTEIENLKRWHND